MTKTKRVGFAVLFAALVLFAYQNWNYPAPPIHFLFFTFPPIPYSLIIYSCLLIGFMAGWAAHGLKIRRTERKQADNYPGS